MKEDTSMAHKLTIAMALWTCSLIGTTASAQQFVVLSLEGPPTAEEIQSVDSYLKANPLVPEGTNRRNNFAYGTAAQRAGQNRSMFALTGDPWYIEQAIRFADHMLKERNDLSSTPRLIWTGEVEPCWPNTDPDAPDAASCGTETAAVVGQLAITAKLIVQNPSLWNEEVGVGDPYGFGRTFLDRALTYIQEGNRTLDDYSLHWFLRPSDNRLVQPTDPRWAALGAWYARHQGNSVPWNQRDFFTNALSNITECLEILGEDPDRQARYYGIFQTVIDQFVAELQPYEVNGRTVVKWSYAPGDLRLRYPEDLSHASADINQLRRAFTRGTFGVTDSTMLAIADTFLEVIAKPDGTFANKVTGTGTRASVSTSWVGYEPFRAGIYQRIVTDATLADAQTNVATAISILSLRLGLFGPEDPLAVINRPGIQ
jgi:hypothetical protein